MIGRLESNLGEILIDTEVIAKVAGITAIECYGIVGMAMVNMASGITKLLRGDSLTKGIHVEIIDNIIYLDFHIVIEYGVNISAVTDTLISTVMYKVESFSGMKVGKINVFVEGVRVDD
jgi:uncharacterized alkaline shock family protein YloU